MPDPADPSRPKRQFFHRLGASWKELADYFDVKSYVRASWPQGDEARELWDYLEARGRLPELAAALAEIDRPDLAELLAGAASTPAASAPVATAVPVRPWRRSRVLVAAVVLFAVGLGAGAAIVRRNQSPEYLRLHTASAPPAAAWGATSTCGALAEQGHAFPASFVGDVYIQFSADPRKTVNVEVTLAWGGMTWTRRVPAMPGDVEHHLGGTLLVFEKRTVDRGRPAGVTFQTDIPVCAIFGTAGDPDPAAPALRLPTPGWR